MKLNEHLALEVKFHTSAFLVWNYRVTSLFLLIRRYGCSAAQEPFCNQQFELKFGI